MRWCTLMHTHTHKRRAQKRSDVAAPSSSHHAYFLISTLHANIHFACPFYATCIGTGAQDCVTCVCKCVSVCLCRVRDMQLMRQLNVLEDEVNVATWHPHPGGGIIYGTKEGKLRFLRHDRWAMRQLSLIHCRGRQACSVDTQAVFKGCHVVRGSQKWAGCVVWCVLQE